jgi:hypothetical protein
MQSSEKIIDMHKASMSFASLITTVAHTEKLKTFTWPAATMPNARARIELVHEQHCYWMPSSTGGALAVLTAPWKKAWYTKRCKELGLPAHDSYYGVWFATLDSNGLPQLSSLLGCVSQHWDNTIPIQMINVESRSDSQALARQARHWGTIATNVWCAQSLALTEAYHAEY